MSALKLSDRLAVILCDRSKRDPNLGICCQRAVINFELHKGIEAWIGDSDRSVNYPVSGGLSAYTEHKKAGTMWRGAYGIERKELLRFLIRYYRERGQ